MALETNEQFVTNAVGDRSSRISPDPNGGLQVVVLAPLGAEATLPKLTPMAWNTSSLKWVPWDADGVNGSDVASGFLIADTLVGDTDDVSAQMFMKGQLHYDDIVAAILSRGVETQNDWDTELDAALLRGKGIFIQGYAAFH